MLRIRVLTIRSEGSVFGQDLQDGLILAKNELTTDEHRWREFGIVEGELGLGGLFCFSHARSCVA